jgi:hypothetical protein
MTLRARLFRAVIVAQLIAGAGCISVSRPAFMRSQPERAWPDALAAAQGQAAAGEFALADTALANFAAAYPGTSQALETAFWRAVFKMDPNNRGASIAPAMALLDGYLADRRPRKHLTEAMSLRRIAGQLDGLTRLTANAMTQAKDATGAAANARATAADANASANATADAKDAEIKRLKDDLAKANAELERIRKRLSQPPPKP